MVTMNIKDIKLFLGWIAALFYFTPGITEALRLLGFDCTIKPYQEQAIRHIIQGKDVVVRAPTGAGKSLIFWVSELFLQHS